MQMPTRFESGNLNMPGIAGLNAATEWLLQQGVSEIDGHIAGLTKRLTEGLSRISGVKLVSAVNGPNTGVVSFNLAAVDCREVATILDQSFGIQCRSGLHCAPLVHKRLGTIQAGGTSRLSPGIFTTLCEIETAINAVSEISANYAGL